MWTGVDDSAPAGGQYHTILLYVQCCRNTTSARSCDGHAETP